MIDRLGMGQTDAVRDLTPLGDKQCTSCLFLRHLTFFFVDEVGLQLHYDAFISVHLVISGVLVRHKIRRD